MAKGALGTDPQKKWKVGTDRATLERQQANLQKRVDAGGHPRAEKRLGKVTSALGALGTDPEAVARQGFDDVTGGSNDYLNNILGRLNSRGEFAPGDYNETRRAAEDSVMNSFERRMNPQFQQEQQMFEQRMAEQGIMPGTELYNRQLTQMQQSQGDARLDAQDRAFQLGQGEQAQGFNQQYQTYNQPLNELNASMPFYGYQQQGRLQEGQQDWQSQENRFDRRFARGSQNRQMEHEKWLQQNAYHPPVGGGGLGYDPYALENQKFYNQMVMQGLQNAGSGGPRPGYGSGAAAGVGTGVAAGVTGALIR